jgi:hypothetical protein
MLTTVRIRIGKRHNRDFVVCVRLEPFEASVSVPLAGLSRYRLSQRQAMFELAGAENRCHAE